MMKILAQAIVFLSGSVAWATATVADLDQAFQAERWNDTIQIASEILQRDPNQIDAKLKGSYALFQRGYNYSGLLLLKKVQSEDWRRLPQGQERFAEIILLFQKRVPFYLLPGRLDQVSAENVSEFFKNEVYFAKGQQAFEHGNLEEAQANLSQISRTSRYFSQASYLLASIVVKKGDYTQANKNLSAIFESAVYDKSSEFWDGLGAQVSSHWGSSLKVLLDQQALSKTTLTGEAAILGFARTAYATKNFEKALNYYSKIGPSSRFFHDAQLESVWTLLALGKHDEAQKAASRLSLEKEGFASISARLQRSIILTDEGHTEEARQELKTLAEVHGKWVQDLKNFSEALVPEVAPAFLKGEIAGDVLLQSLFRHIGEVKAEIESVRHEDSTLFPVYAKLAAQLQQLLAESNQRTRAMMHEKAEHRLDDLESIWIQGQLVLAETYLEDREKLRAEFKALTTANEEKQKEHDRRLVEYLSRAVETVDGVLKRQKTPKLSLQFRQSELLWELSSATTILSQTSHDPKDDEKAAEYRKRSVQITEDLVFHHPGFEKAAEALFLLGYGQIESGDEKSGYASLDRFVKLYPQHERTPDAYRILGDLDFDANRFAVAEERYQKILAFPESSIVGYGLYKIGWCAYNRRQFARALLGFEQAVLWTRKREQDRQLLTLRSEAERDLVSIYAEVGDYKKAQEYFSQYFHDDLNQLLGALAQQFDVNGQYEKASFLYRLLITLDPAHQDVLHYRTGIIQDAGKLQNWDRLSEVSEELAKSHGDWLRHAKHDDKTAIQAEAAFRDVVLNEHFIFGKTDVPEIMERILKHDEIYLSIFGDWNEAKDPTYRHAHLLLKAKKQAEALAEFRHFWERFGRQAEEPLREEALRNYIHVLELSSADGKEEWSAETLKVTDEYMKLYPGQKTSRDIGLLRSVVFFKTNKVEDGIKMSQELFDADSSDAVGKSAFKNLVKAYYDLKDWKRANDWATAISKVKANAELYKNELKTMREETLFLVADRATDPEKAAVLYLKIADESGMEHLQDKSLYNAFLRFYQTSKKKDALSAASRLEKVNPKFEHLSEIAGIRAALYQEAGDYESALTYLDAFLATPPSNATQEALTQAKNNAKLISQSLINNMVSQARAPAGSEKDPLARAREEYLRRPIAPHRDLAEKIKRSATALEVIVKKFVDFSTNEKNPLYQAYEAYCTLPLFYRAYGDQLVTLGVKDPELTQELIKIAQPIYQQAKGFADQCIDRSAQVEHDGPIYRKVLDIWGWQHDEDLKQKVDQLTHSLEKDVACWESPNPAYANATEAEIISKHLDSKGDSHSWYALAFVRWKAKKIGLSRLTLVDLLNKNPQAPEVLQGMACIDEARGTSGPELTALYDRAAQAGSSHGWARLALRHFKGARFPAGLAALKQADKKKAFEGIEALKALVESILQGGAKK